MPPHSLHLVGNWTIERACFEVEKYNGFGYRTHHPEVKSPYLWSFSTNFERGKYVSDGHFDRTAVDKQCGAMPILKQMMELDSSVRLDRGAVVSIPDMTTLAMLTTGSKGEQVRHLQVALANQGFQVGEIDGDYGPNTAAAVKAFQTARHLPATSVADQATLQALAIEPEPRAPEVLKPHDILLAIINALKMRAPAPDGPPAVPSDSAANLLQLILGALMGSRPAAAQSGGVPAAPILSSIDKVLGGEALVGKKTALSVIAYVVLAILKAAGVVGAATRPGRSSQC
jgi:peptidoglycan hydrolase-like protein with peptidoglycan-binding domain